MTKIKIIVALAGVVVLGGIFYWTANNKTSDSKESSSNVNDMVSQDQRKMAFADFVEANRDGSYKCSVDQYIDGGFEQKTTGTAYVHNGMIRGDYNTVAQSMSIDSSVIVRDGFVYSWTSISPFGTKVEIKNEASMESDNSAGGTQGSYSWNSEAIGEYQCDPWALDQTVFEIPASVQFRQI